MQYKRAYKELNLVWIAVAFFTRIPVPKSVDFSPQKLNLASRYFSLVGWLVGGLCALVLMLFSQFFAMNIAIIISMAFGILLTGCFHEDGLADTCDGFGGGWQRDQKLLIMKDSRLGTYGAVSIWFALSFKLLLLTQIQISSVYLSDTQLHQTLSVATVLIVAHVLSRSFSTAMIYCLPYVTDEEQSKVKPLAEKLSAKDLIINLSIGFVSLIFILDVAILIVASLLVTFFVLKKIYQKQIGGFTGDTLGAAQQISELVVYLTVLSSIPSSGVLL